MMSFLPLHYHLTTALCTQCAKPVNIASVLLVMVNYAEPEMKQFWHLVAYASMSIQAISRYLN